MYHSGKNPLRRVTYKSEGVDTVKSPEQRKLHKAFLRYHDPHNWPTLRDALKRMGRADLIGDGPRHLIPRDQPRHGDYQAPRRKNTAAAHRRRTRPGQIETQHTGLPPRDAGSGGSGTRSSRKPRRPGNQR